MPFSDMFSQNQKSLHPYIPGEQPQDRTYIKLNANENPYPPSPKVAQIVSDFVLNETSKLALYPDPDSNILRSSIAKMLNATSGCLANAKPGLNITSDMIFCSNGSDEVLSFIFYAFFDKNIPLVSPKYSYSFYPVYASYYDIPLAPIALKSDWSLDIDSMLDYAISHNSPIIIANPNAPTSLALSMRQVQALLENAPKNKVVVIDEAYVDFADYSCIGLLEKAENLVIVRTFSKSLCAAGLRVGYAVANPTLIKGLLTVKNSFNHFPLDALTQKAAVATCYDFQYYIEKAKKIVEQREDFITFLKGRDYEVLPSKTNFVFTQNPKKMGLDIYTLLKKEGILVRRFDIPGIENYLRITIGTASQMHLLKNALLKI